MPTKYPILAAAALFLATSYAAVIPVKPRDHGGAFEVLHTGLGADELVYQIGNITYFTPTTYPKAKAPISGSGELSSPQPITAVSLDAGSLSVAGLKAFLETAGGDDVWTKDFLTAVFLSCVGSGCSLSDDVAGYLASYGTRALILDPSVSGRSSSIATYTSSESYSGLNGPYLASFNASVLSLHPTYRLYHDRERTFVFGAYPVGDGSGNYRAFDRVTTEFGDPWIPVPSRLYSKSSEGLLAGQRLAVKDIYDVAGLQTAAGSRAYAETYPEAFKNAVSVQRLLDLGAVIVGKTKTAQFASGASTNDVTVDVQYPFSPRSDGWQSCGASSSGSGCAMAAYDWVDAGLGSDTGGSVRVPAAISGLYGNRPTTGAISLEGVLPLGAAFDTAGILVRDPYQFSKYGKAWYAESDLAFQNYSSFPKRIIYPSNYLPHGSDEGQAIIENFVQSMQSTFGMERVVTNVTEEILGAGFNITTINFASSVWNSWNQWKLVGEPLAEAYGAANGGRFPPLDPARRANWPNARANYSDALYDASLPVIGNFSDWFNNEFIPYNSQTCSESIYVYDIGTGGLPAYRENVLNDGVTAITPFSDPRGNPLNQASVSPDSGCVDITIPIGQAKYNSTVTFIEEIHPVTISLIARAGCDFMLFDFVEKLADAGLIGPVKTGRTAF